MRADGVASLIARGEIREHNAFLGHEMRDPAGTERGGVSMAGGREGQGARQENGLRGHRLPPSSENFYVFRLSVSMRKVAGQHPFCVLIYMNSYIFHIYFILSISLSHVTPVAGLIFEAKIERCFLESFFRERNFCPEQLSRAKNVARF